MSGCPSAKIIASSVAVVFSRRDCA
ncbi:unnamed protein product [Kuraishia capsulata CBS 1993]|uniref:Uncharacterized protein n=1 Tax=Kuraishia capsulata CBS 1993 TaxID=1382522 RepID=W6MKD0_9ASCO|nr:unnamed protein product [Kuraishia capsulata CBS 1993]